MISGTVKVQTPTFSPHLDNISLSIQAPARQKATTTTRTKAATTTTPTTTTPTTTTTIVIAEVAAIDPMTLTTV